MTEPEIAQKASYPVAVPQGEKYFWCAYGRSANQPFRDGSHKDTGLAPLPWSAAADKTLYFCGCKRIGGAPLCDGSHNQL